MKTKPHVKELLEGFLGPAPPAKLWARLLKEGPLEDWQPHKERRIVADLFVVAKEVLDE